LKELSSEDQKEFLRGVEQFNKGFYFECHDTLEEVWNGVRGPSRDFLQGLIQVSVAFYHLTSGNLEGAESLLGRALKRFASYPDRCYGFDLGAHRLELRNWLEKIRSADVDPLEPLPRWIFDEA
jgi:predicted metal-dependent hydrolase